MDNLQVLTQINNVPQPFKRGNTTFLQFVDSYRAAISRYTNSSDGILEQLNFASAFGGWLDLWGLLLGLTRKNNESDAAYSIRITVTLTGGAGPVEAMLNWVQVAWGVTISITEYTSPACGYTITFPGTLTSVQINQILSGLTQIRPAGVPFDVQISNIGTYLDTINFLDAGLVTGAYIGGGTTPFNPTLGAGTNNSPPLLPELLLTDPTLNPSLSQA